MLIINILSSDEEESLFFEISGSKRDEEVTKKIKILDEPQLQIVEITKEKKKNKLPFPFV